MTQGVRLTLLLATQSPDELVYRGTAALGASELSIEVTLTREGDGVSATAQATGATGDERARLEQLAASLVRATAKGALLAGEPAPRRIQRWRQWMPPPRSTMR